MQARPLSLNWKVWLMAARPKTLSAAIVPVVVATALAKQQTGHAIWWVTACALLASVLIQIGTNFINDAIDFKKGADSATRTGPQRVTQSGLLSADQVMRAGFVCFAFAALLGIPLVIQGGWLIFVVGLVSLVLGYAYTGGPFPLAYLGLGDLFVILFFGVIAVSGTFILHAQTLGLPAVIAGLQVGCLATVLIAINNFRDSPQDVLVGKRTLAVRFGSGFARFEIAVLLILPFLLGFYWSQLGLMKAAILPCVGIPLARRILAGIFRQPPGPAYNQFLALAGALQMIFGLALAVALWRS
jgi:1,4-dihydroxy-2-naphthoate octaprenyltransferase